MSAIFSVHGHQAAPSEIRSASGRFVRRAVCAVPPPASSRSSNDAPTTATLKPPLAKVTQPAPSEERKMDEKHMGEEAANSKKLRDRNLRTVRQMAVRKGADGVEESVVTLERGGAGVSAQRAPLLMTMKPLPRILLIHTGGTLGMDPTASYTMDQDEVTLEEGTGGVYKQGLVPSQVLADLRHFVPELQSFGNLDVVVPFNRDSCRVGPKEWVKLAKLLHANRSEYHAFLLVHGTDTMAYTASALSIMLAGFGKPIVITGSQLPLLLPRSDARQNLIDSITVATAGAAPPYVQLREVAICFGGKLLRGNRAQKSNSAIYQAFSSPSYPELAKLGVEVDWNVSALLQEQHSYQPRFNLDSHVIRIPIVPGSDPRLAYGDLYKRGVRGVVLEAFGLGNMPDMPSQGWLPWLRAQTKQGLMVSLSSQCLNGELHPELYRSGAVAISLGCQSGPQMTPECAVAKMMLCLKYRDLHLTHPLAGEL